MDKRRTYEELETELRATRARLDEVEETLRAIRNNEVDALVVEGPRGVQVFTLQGAEQPYRTLMETMAEGAITVATNGMVLYCNQRFAAMLGTPLNRIIGRSLGEVMPFKDWQALQAILGTCETSGCRGEYRLITTGGREITTSVSARRVQLQDVECFCLVVSDLTEQHSFEKQLRRAQKLEALGTLAGGIAHDLNNALAGIIGFAEMVLEDTAPDSPDHRRLTLVLKAAHRGRDLVKQILLFSRQGEPHRRPVTLVEVVEETLKLLGPAFPSTIEVLWKRPEDDCRILADPAQMHQVITNLCTNAAHAMREAGCILRIAASQAIVAEGSPPPVPEMAPGEYVVLEVSDSGCGMDTETIEQAFDPFFTTKREGEGTGLGLSVTHGIVKNHGGYMAVESEPGKGSRFLVYLPRFAEETMACDERESSSPAGGKERILVVDDEDILVELNRQRLSDFGYDVAATTSGVVALQMFRRAPDSFDLVITDQTMPHLTGMDLAAELLKIRPGIPIILSTGYSDKVSPERAQEAGVQKLLMKPFDKRELAEVVGRVLDKNKKG
jgi:PAS domain S-box-containing protein